MTHHEKAIEEMKEYLKDLHKIKNKTPDIINEIDAITNIILDFAIRQVIKQFDV